VKTSTGLPCQAALYRMVWPSEAKAGGRMLPAAESQLTVDGRSAGTEAKNFLPAYRPAAAAIEQSHGENHGDGRLAARCESRGCSDHASGSRSL